jgi:SAM-dependent methyltransferase
VGCGAGRFAEVALSFGARVVAVDRSLAVEAARDNLGDRPDLAVLQADLLALPFAQWSFDFVYCFGVLQHTPDPRRAFLGLPPLLGAGGRLAVDVYPRLLRNRLWPKYWLRPLTSRLSPATLERLVELGFPLLYPASLTLGRIPRAGRLLRYLVPVANYEGVYPLDGEKLREWALLDTIDMLGPRYDTRRAGGTAPWCQEAASRRSRSKMDFVARGRRPATPSLTAALRRWASRTLLFHPDTVFQQPDLLVHAQQLVPRDGFVRSLVGPAPLAPA